MISKKYTYVVGWGGIIFSSGLNRFVLLEDSSLCTPPNQVIESVQYEYGCLCSQFENEVDLQQQDKFQVQTGSGVTLMVYKNVPQEDKKVILVKSYDKPIFPGVHAFPSNTPSSRPGRRANTGRIINPPGGYRRAPRVLSNRQEQQAGNRIKNKENSGEPDKGSGSNSDSPEYEDTCPSKSSSNDQKPGIRYGEYGEPVRREVLPKKISSVIDADARLVRLAKEACNNQKVQKSINRLQDELAKGNNNPGLHKKYLGNDVWEHRARKGGRLYTKETKTSNEVLILAKSGKENQSKVIERVQELYINEKN